MRVAFTPLWCPAAGVPAIEADPDVSRIRNRVAALALLQRLPIGYFRSIPYELKECALIDGATRK